MKERLAALSE